jgi:hypothetical protein
MYLWVIYISPGSAWLFCCSQIGRPIMGVNHWHIHECRDWEQGCSVWILGIHKSDFRNSTGFNFVYSKLCDIALFCAAFSNTMYKKVWKMCHTMQWNFWRFRDKPHTWFWLRFRLKLWTLAGKSRIFLGALIFLVEFITYQYLWTELYIQRCSVCQLAAVTEEACMVILYGIHLNTTSNGNDIEAKRNETSILRHFLYRSETKKLILKLWRIEAKRTKSSPLFTRSKRKRTGLVQNFTETKHNELC